MSDDIPAKLVSASSIENHTYKIFPNDLNSNETVFGGLVMSISDRVASTVAERHSGARTCVTAQVDSMHFLTPAERGDTLIFFASVNRTWNSSMEIGVKVLAENFHLKTVKHILSAYFVCVALDVNRVPVKIPAVMPETDIQRRRYEEADRRRTRRQAERKEKQAKDAKEFKTR
jgi:acyl-CoA hydrolase